MVKTFSTFGSCSSRNIFASAVNENYKKFFKICLSLENVSLISLMSNPVDFDSKLINATNPYTNFCVKHDLIKTEYLDFLKNNSPDYLVLDTYCDVLDGIIEIDENRIITNSRRLIYTDINNLFENKKRYSIKTDFNKYMDLWAKACESFFKFIEKTKIKVILNCSRAVYQYFSHSENKITGSRKLRDEVPEWHNYYRDILDHHILKNYDVLVLPFDYTTLSNENHVWGLHPTHYEPRFYTEKTMQLNDIIELDELSDYSNKFYIKLRETLRKNLVFQIEQNIQTNSKNNIIDYLALEKYLTCRIDMKNEGIDSNSIEILDISDDNAQYNFPQWFSDDNGKGMSIHSKQGKLNIKIRIINEGKLFIRFMGMDIKNENGKRVPIFIRYTNIFINGEKINNDEKTVWHDSSFIFRKNVKNFEIINIEASWKMF